MAELQEVIEAYSEYVVFLEDESSKQAAYMHVHGHRARPEVVQKGKDLRRRIAEVTGVPGHDV